MRHDATTVNLKERRRFALSCAARNGPPPEHRPEDPSLMWRSPMQTLERLLREQGEFTKLSGVVLDDFGENPEFPRWGRPFTSTPLDRVVTQLRDEHFPGDSVLGLSPRRVPERGWIEGVLLVGGRLVMVFPWEPIHARLVTVREPSLSGSVPSGRWISRHPPGRRH